MYNDWPVQLTTGGCSVGPARISSTSHTLQVGVQQISELICNVSNELFPSFHRIEIVTFQMNYLMLGANQAGTDASMTCIM